MEGSGCGRIGPNWITSKESDMECAGTSSTWGREAGLKTSSRPPMEIQPNPHRSRPIYEGVYVRQTGCLYLESPWDAEGIIGSFKASFSSPHIPSSPVFTQAMCWEAEMTFTFWLLLFSAHRGAEEVAFASNPDSNCVWYPPLEWVQP